MLNKDILPVIPSKGSVGASGDLAPLAHMACAMIGASDVNYKGKILKAYFEELTPTLTESKGY